MACGGPVLPVLRSVYRACSPWNFHSQAASCNSAHCRWWKWSSSALGCSEQRVRGRETKPGAHCFLLSSSVQRQLNPLSPESSVPSAYVLPETGRETQSPWPLISRQSKNRYFPSCKTVWRLSWRHRVNGYVLQPTGEKLRELLLFKSPGKMPLLLCIGVFLVRLF